MVFGGLQETTLIDFPGRVACILFTAGCNFKCPYCHNPELLSFSTAPVIKQQRVFDFLEERSGFLDGVVITGGEPTLHKDLLLFMKQVKEMGFEVKLDTNGSRPHIVEQVLEQNLADYVAMDIKTLPENYAKMVSSPVLPEKIKNSIKHILNSGVNHEFRTTCAWPMIDSDIINKLGSLVFGAHLWVLQKCRDERMLCPDFFKNAQKVYTFDDVEKFAALALPFVDKILVR